MVLLRVKGSRRFFLRMLDSLREVQVYRVLWVLIRVPRCAMFLEVLEALMEVSRVLSVVPGFLE